MTKTTTSMLSWNVQLGGFSAYDPGLEHPERGDNIHHAIGQVRQHHGIEVASLTDTYRWDEVYGSDADIARHLGFASARLVRLDDDSLGKTGAGISVTVATDLKIQKSWALDLGTRQGLGVILDKGRHGLQVATAYLHHENEDRRAAQARALIASLEPDLPTVIVGDLNTLRADISEAKTGTRLRHSAVTMLARALGNYTEFSRTVNEMTSSKVIPVINAGGFTDAGKPDCLPTYPARLPLVGVDYVFHNDIVQVHDLRRGPATGVSDHRYQTFKVTH